MTAGTHPTDKGGASELRGAWPDSLRAERRGSVAVLRLSRPQKRNALDDETVLGIENFFATLPDDVKAVALHGEGEHFCAGLDLNVLSERNVSEGITHSRMWHRAFDRIQFGKVPVVAALHGAVIGGGLELAAATHIRVAEHSAFYALPEGSRGIFVGGGGSVRLSRLIGVARMMDMMLTGRTYQAVDGQQIGLTQYVVESGQGFQKAFELAERIATNAPLTNFAIMQVLPRAAENDPASGLLMEALMSAIAQGDEIAKARVREFLEKQSSKKSGN
jgi:enoyl-CoA hydratase/carnithine racemase